MFPLLTIASMAVNINSLAKKENFIKENWKPIVGIGAALGVGYMVWNLYSDFRKKGDNPTRDLELGEDKNFPPSTLSDSKALTIANRLQGAMGTWGDSNEKEVELIKSLLIGLTYNDYVKVSKFFGQRGYITMTGISKDSDILAPKKNLAYWLSKELSPEDLNALGKIIPNAF